MSAVVEAAAALRRALIEFDPALHTGSECAAIAESLAQVEKASAAGRARAASRAAACHAHRERGFADAADWMAGMAGTTRAAAKAAADAVEAVEACEATKQALVSGEVSMAQAAVIAATEAERPGVEDELLALARRTNLTTLKDEARERRLGAIDRDELARRQRAARSGTHWVDDLGMVWAKVGLAPETGVAFVNRWDAETDRVWRAAHRSGDPVSREQAAADAFVVLARGEAKRGRGHAEVVAVVDVEALRRGHTHGAERSHLIGGGPVPVATIREMVEGDAFVKAVVLEGTAITTVKHFGRHINAQLRTALLLGPAPELRGAICSVEGCGRRYGLEIDHERPRAGGGATELVNLDWKCGGDHRRKSRAERAAGLYDPAAWDQPP